MKKSFDDQGVRQRAPLELFSILLHTIYEREYTTQKRGRRTPFRPAKIAGRETPCRRDVHPPHTDRQRRPATPAGPPKPPIAARRDRQRLPDTHALTLANVGFFSPTACLNSRASRLRRRPPISTPRRGKKTDGRPSKRVRLPTLARTAPDRQAQPPTLPQP